MKTLGVRIVLAVVAFLTAALIPDDTMAQCLACGQSTCSSGEHQMAGAAPWGWIGQVHPCWAMTCYEAHDECTNDEDFDETDAAALASLSNQPAWKIRYLLQRYPDRVVFNEARGAVQLIGCDGVSIVAHVRLRSDQLAPVLADR